MEKYWIVSTLAYVIDLNKIKWNDQHFQTRGGPGLLFHTTAPGVDIYPVFALKKQIMAMEWETSPLYLNLEMSNPVIT